VLGVTDEGKGDTEPWIEAKGVEYAYAYDKGGKLKGKLGVGGIPHAFLIGPTGRIVWEGHPGTLTEKIISKALVGALPKPLYEFPASAAAVKSALIKRKYATALEEVAKLSEADGAELKKAITDLVSARVGSMNASLKEGDFLTAQEDAGALAKELAGLPELAEATKALDEIKASKDAARVIAAQKKIRALQGQRLGKRMEYEKALADLDKIAKELEGTFAATEAKELRKEIAARKRS
jgi:hypothetical protein